MPGDPRPPIEASAHLAGTATASADAQVVSLDQVAERVGYSVADQIALRDAGLRERDAALRKKMANRIVRAFTRANVVVLVIVGALVVLDEINIASHVISPSDRIITPQVFMALLGATTVQVGTIAAIIARYLFPGRSRDG